MNKKILALALSSAALSLALATPAFAQDVLITNATVHTAQDGRVIENGRVLIRDGRIREVGTSVSAPRGVATFDAAGRHLTPGLFGGVAPAGLVEVSAEDSTTESRLDLSGAPHQHPVMRPEFNPIRAYNPHSTPIAVNRVEGVTFGMVGASGGGSLIAGQGQLARFDGSYDPAISGSDTLFMQLGARSKNLSGESRAGQYMLLEQAFDEARADRKSLDGEVRLMTKRGRGVLAKFLQGGRVLVSVSRAADILQVIKLAKANNFKPIILGGSDAWMVADEIAAAKVPVILNPLANLPGNFDHLGARLDHAKLLQDAGVTIAFSLGDAHNSRKLRQAAGNAVANGLEWEDALAAITSTPAEIFGQGDAVGSIEKGQIADLVLWSGDPLEITSVAEALWMGGQSMPMQSRQTKLRDRYLEQDPEMPRQYIKP
ncbi:MAG: amidohydrolase family protein [Xanthomonadales bacterium]|nr:amidohydrolase family protein [Xanthomonadales bacterium]